MNRNKNTSTTEILQYIYLNYATESIYNISLHQPPHLHGPEYIHALYKLSKDHVFAIQPVSFINSDEELRAVTIGTWVCHW